MDVYATEEQQVEAIKKWWKENGTSTIVGIILAVGVLIGGRVWLDQKSNHAEIASAKYDTLLSAMNQGMNDIALEQSSGLIGQFSDTPYAALAALASAKIKLEKGELLAARTHLQWVVDQAPTLELKQVARMRLARVMLSDGDHQQALALLGQVDAGEFQASFAEIKGDIYLAMKQPGKAKTAYELAISILDPKSANQNLLRMKLEDLGVEKNNDGNVVIVK